MWPQYPVTASFQLSPSISSTPATRKAQACLVWILSLLLKISHGSHLSEWELSAVGSRLSITLPLHFPCPLQPHPQDHPCSLHFHIALISKARLKHPHLRALYLCFLSLHLILRCPYEPLPLLNSSFRCVLLIQISYSCMTSLHSSTITSHTIYLFILLLALLPKEISAPWGQQLDYFIHCWVPATSSEPY